jgi:hypothetical protein
MTLENILFLLFLAGYGIVFYVLPPFLFMCLFVWACAALNGR